MIEENSGISTMGPSHKSSQHNLYDLSDNKQRIKTQAGVRKRANYSQENLPSVEGGLGVPSGVSTNSHT